MLEVENYANTQTRDAQIIQHQPTFMVGDAVNYLVSMTTPSNALRSGMKMPTFCPL